MSDLSNCDQEQIQFSNAVQPHAVLLAMDPESGAILQASANVKEIARAPAAELAGAAVETVLGTVPMEEIRQLPDNRRRSFCCARSSREGRAMCSGTGSTV